MVFLMVSYALAAKFIFPTDVFRKVEIVIRLFCCAFHCTNLCNNLIASDSYVISAGSKLSIFLRKLPFESTVQYLSILESAHMSLRNIFSRLGDRCLSSNQWICQWIHLPVFFPASAVDAPHLQFYIFPSSNSLLPLGMCLNPRLRLSLGLQLNLNLIHPTPTSSWACALAFAFASA
jgi:hypothetical protein